MLARVTEADSAAVDIAVAAARRAFEAPSWAGISPDARTRVLLKIADAVERHAEELAVLETLDVGAPLSFSLGCVANVAETFRYYAGRPPKIMATTHPTDAAPFTYMLPA